MIETHFVDLGVAAKIILNGMGQCERICFAMWLGGELMQTRRQYFGPTKDRKILDQLTEHLTFLGGASMF